MLVLSRKGKVHEWQVFEEYGQLPSESISAIQSTLSLPALGTADREHSSGFVLTKRKSESESMESFGQGGRVCPQLPFHFRGNSALPGYGYIISPNDLRNLNGCGG